MQATYPSAITPYPVRVEGRLQPPSRWLWMIKWLLALPHFIVLAFLWLAFTASSVAALIAVMFTGRYPRSLFDFNVGVMRWSWRVAFYAYGANGTDRYPPFTLGEAPDYPARLQVAYPEHQRRGLALLGWWLAGIPQYLIAGLFLGGGLAGWTAWAGSGWGGLIGLLVLVAALVLLFDGSYPRSIFDFVLGLDRWVLRVVAYAAVMTPDYPPFRLDAGESDPAGAMTVTSPALASNDEGQAASPSWGAARITATLLASVVALVGIVAMTAGGAATGLDRTQRDAAGYLMTPTESYSTGAYALVSRSYRLGAVGDRFVARELLGTVSLRAQGNRPVFVGIAPAAAVTNYLAGVADAEAGGLGAQSAGLQTHAGRAPATPPVAQHFWVASATGAGARTLTWKVRPGAWRVVVMNADGARGVSSELSIGASFPHLLGIGIALLAGGLLTLLLAGGALYVLVRGRHDAN
jgi:hypothetical protein